MKYRKILIKPIIKMKKYIKSISKVYQFSGVFKNTPVFDVSEYYEKYQVVYYQ